MWTRRGGGGGGGGEKVRRAGHGACNVHCTINMYCIHVHSYVHVHVHVHALV